MEEKNKNKEIEVQEEEPVEENAVELNYEDTVTNVSVDLIIVAARLAGIHKKRQGEVLEDVAKAVTKITE